jgi:hypothetical protein
MAWVMHRRETIRGARLLVEHAVPEIGNRSGLFDGENARKLVVKL